MSFPPVHEPPQRHDQEEGDIGGNDGSGDIGVSHGSPQYQPYEEPYAEQEPKKTEVNLAHGSALLRTARWARLL